MTLGPRARIALALVLGLALLAAARLESFTEPFLEFDEGIYLLMAREVAHGHLPYSTLFDAKPPGFFLLLGAAVRIFGANIYVLRAIACLSVLATCSGLYAMAAAFASERRAIAWLAVASYAGMTASGAGLAANAELILTPFVVWAFVPIVRAAANRSRLDARVAFASGLLLGIAVELKLTALGEAAFALAFAGFAAGAGAAGILAMAAGIALPSALMLGVYAADGSVPNFLAANVFAMTRRVGFAPSEHVSIVRTIVQQFRSFLPSSLLVLLVPFALPACSSRERRLALWLAAWVVFDFVQVFAEGELYPHQFLDAMAPAAILGAWCAVRILRRTGPQRFVPAILGALGLFALVVHAAPSELLAAGQLRGHGLNDRDALAAYLRTNLAHRTLFVVDDWSLFYALANEPIPSRYAPFFSSAALARLAGFDAQTEIDRVFATEPQVVLRTTDADTAGDEGSAISTDIASHLHAAYSKVFCAGLHCAYSRDPR